MSTSIFEDLESDVRSYCRSWPVVFETARGSRLHAEDGESYLDFFSGAGALNYGHNDPDLKRALLEYLAADGVVHSLDTYTTAKRRFLTAFEHHVLRPRGLDHKVQFTGPTGTNSVEAALKLARLNTGRTGVTAFTNAFHGMTLGSLSVTGNAMKRNGAGVPLPFATTAPYDGYLDDPSWGLSWLARTWADSSSGVERPAAVIVETVQGEGGLNAARAGWLRELEALCRAHEVLLIVDDVQAGCGRTGTFFSFEDAGITPDIVCLSKSISGYGLPMALVLLRPELDIWQPGQHNGTFRGNNAAFVTGTAALEKYWADGGTFQRSVVERGRQLGEGLTRIAALVEGATCRGRGLLAGVHFPDPELAERIAGAAFERHLLVETSGARSEVLKAMPALNISQEDLDEGLELLMDATRAVLADRYPIDSSRVKARETMPSTSGR
ncbi:diaminobutyrate--2-oxoglutarate transaminase [Kocuria sp. UCD-OTCP]|uniref:diaminobutyrate--2-oxoglutarate transaminase n=1 Tax=Kocuria sp. UCD-OTCP TaxID=1292021 RepID=UPI00036A1D55|nr:diaminobutyrate--2-oxoglutarate transaminase [Kocuria sp. UCD-OTCP]EYT48863.1 diaminobutyrate--2-oxoglutarate aminotransferase [Kocuria sp. UCD-OTCP]